MAEVKDLNHRNLMEMLQATGSRIEEEEREYTKRWHEEIRKACENGMRRANLNSKWRRRFVMGGKIHFATAVANQSYRVKMTDDVVVNAIKNMEMPEEWKFHIYDFFADNPPQIILEFCEEYEISLEELKEFYEKLVKPYFRNRYLEEVWEY